MFSEPERAYKVPFLASLWVLSEYPRAYIMILGGVIEWKIIKICYGDVLCESKMKQVLFVVASYY